jgi:hypothetical protein
MNHDMNHDTSPDPGAAIGPPAIGLSQEGGGRVMWYN